MGFVAREKEIPLAKALGGVKERIEVGVSVGILESEAVMLKQIEGYIQEGYKRIKVKIKPGWDLHILKAIRTQFPDIQLMADANCAYTLNDVEYLKKLEEFDLTMIEQPLYHDDIIDHAKLQSQLQTPICLDVRAYILSRMPEKPLSSEAAKSIILSSEGLAA